MPDLDAYFARIGYTGPRGPTPGTLWAIQFHHATSISFENVDVLLGRPVRVDLPSVERKLVVDRRGGYCFENNTLLLAVLSALGFRATPLSARVRFNVARDVTPPRTHLLLRVDFEHGSYLADCGVGAATPTAPVPLVYDVEHETPHERRRLVQDGGRSFVQIMTGSGWSDVCEFTGDPMPDIDRVVANHFTSTHPTSRFRNNLMAAAVLPDGTRYTLLNREVTQRRGAEVMGAWTVAGPDELLDVLEKRFGIRLPIGTRLGEAPSGQTPWPT